MRYSKASPRLIVKFVDSDTNAVLFEVKDRSWMNVGDMLTDGAITSIMKTEYRGDPPENLMILVVAEFELHE
jgi:hypothetical protein